ncbi:MAG: uncharacterized protein JWN40_4976 [Phycisphaerales bacterium]|nr:uncharacterized protein [Phycisphaerales bacterium]
MFPTAFNREMLTLARESRGLTQTALAEAISFTPSLVSKFESGIVLPTDDNLQRIADVLDYPLDFFAQTDRIYGLGCSFLYHRKRKTMPVPEQRRLVAVLNTYRMQIERLLRNTELEADNTFAHMDAEQFGGPEGVAQRVRLAWRLSDGPIQNLVAAIEAAGGIVVRHAFNNDRASGMSWWLPETPPLFFVNADMPGDHQRFTLAHELGHVLMHRIPHERIEDEANQFAAELLMPAKEIAPDLGALTLERSAGLKAYWKTAMQAIIRRAKDLGRISPDRYQRLQAEIGMAGYRRNEPIPIPPENPTLLADLVRLHVDKHGYGLDDLCRMSILRNPREFRDRFAMGISAMRLVN